MNANDTGAERLRLLFAGDHRIAESRMFGGRAFMLNGNMVCGFTKKGELIVRLGPSGEAEAKQFADGGDIDFDHKMGSMLFVPEHMVGDDAELKRWIDLALRYVSTLPAK